MLSVLSSQTGVFKPDTARDAHGDEEEGGGGKTLCLGSGSLVLLILVVAPLQNPPDVSKIKMSERRTKAGNQECFEKLEKLSHTL